MGKNNKKGPKANVFKVAGAKSLKKSKAKQVNLGLKNMKQKVQDMDAQFVEMSKSPIASQQPKKEPKQQEKQPPKQKTTLKDIEKATEDIVKMDL